MLSPGDLGQSLPPCGLEVNVLSPGDLGQSLPPWWLEVNVPTPCGLGLKFTVGTAVSVSPLGQEVKRQRRSDGPGTTKGGGGGREGGRGDKKTFKYFFVYPGYYQ